MAERTMRIMDSTLRDGSHAKAHQFTAEQVAAVAAGLDAAGVEVIEVSHGDGLGGSSYQYGFARETDENLLAAASGAVRNAKLAVLLIPGIGTAEDLEMARHHGASVARICTHVTEADVCEQHIQMAKKLGMEAVGFLMMAHMVSPKELCEQGRKMESYGADCVYVVDSAGAMTPYDVRARVSALREAINIDIGLHAHNNLSLGVANNLVAMEEGATCLDGCTCGLGGGAGNTQTEVLVAVLDKLGVQTGIDTFKIMDVGEDVVRPIMDRPQVIDRAGLTLGYAGVYSSFLLHAYRAAEKFDVDVREILLECGRRKTVGGQEDMLVDIAWELNQRKLATKWQV
ncbi:MAG: mhpE [Chloroflexi bacterium]|nr:mhpE [Chloroflexota bacterium]